MWPSTPPELIIQISHYLPESDLLTCFLLSKKHYKALKRTYASEKYKIVSIIVPNRIPVVKPWPWIALTRSKSDVRITAGLFLEGLEHEIVDIEAYGDCGLVNPARRIIIEYAKSIHIHVGDITERRVIPQHRLTQLLHIFSACALKYTLFPGTTKLYERIKISNQWALGFGVPALDSVNLQSANRDLTRLIRYKSYKYGTEEYVTLGPREVERGIWGEFVGYLRRAVGSGLPVRVWCLCGRGETPNMLELMRDGEWVMELVQDYRGDEQCFLKLRVAYDGGEVREEEEEWRRNAGVWIVGPP